jgi:hypothetical protein
MLEIPDDRCERHRLFQAIDDAFKAGDLRGEWADAVRVALPKCREPSRRTLLT